MMKRQCRKLISLSLTYLWVVGISQLMSWMLPTGHSLGDDLLAAEKELSGKTAHQHSHSEAETDPHEGKEEEEHGHEHSEEGHGDEHGHDDHDEEEGGARFGPGKAITAANKRDGIQLSDKAVKTLGLTYGKVSGTITFKLPVKATVFFQDEVGVYRVRDGWHKLIEVTLVSKSSSEVVVKTAEIKPGDQIVTQGVPLLRAAELEAWGGSGDGHGH